MKIFRRTKPLLFFMVVASAAFFLGMSYEYEHVQAQAPAPDTALAQAEPAPAPQPVAEVKYDYVAQPNDSYTQMARKAIQTYGLKNNLTISQAKIIFAETNMTIEAGSPILNLGQAVSINEPTVKAWVDKAGALDAATEAAWQYYVQFVDFNTNAIGQPSVT